MPSVFIEHKEDAAKSIIPFLNVRFEDVSRLDVAASTRAYGLYFLSLSFLQDTLWKENPES